MCHTTPPKKFLCKPKIFFRNLKLFGGWNFAGGQLTLDRSLDSHHAPAANNCKNGFFIF